MTGSGHGTSGGLLAGVRVLEFGQIAAGPFAGSLLADLGADVVKVENPAGGDGMRGWPPLSSTDGGPAFSENFASVNRNKRSIAVDLKDAASFARLKALCAVADVVLENFRAGVLGRLGLGYDTLKALNRRIVYCLHFRLWAARTVCRKGRLRRDRAGHGRADERHRRGGSS